MNVFGIKKAFEIKKARGWDTLYWAIDFHDTLFQGMYDQHQSIELYPYAALVLHKLCRTGNVLIAFTSTPLTKTEAICRYLYKEYGITFTYINENPAHKAAGDYADFSKKFYFNVLIDDKAGFDPKTDWHLIEDEMIRIGEW